MRYNKEMSKPVREAKRLNSEQQKATKALAGPVLVIAGAGTGKTSVIVERVANLLQQGTHPKRLLALTFTEKAASEMLDRVNDFRSSFELELPIMTFNAYGESLLRQYASDIGLSRNFKVLSESAKIVFLRERLDALNLDYFAPISRPDGLLGDITQYFSQLKQNVLTPEEIQKFVNTLPIKDDAEQLEKAKYHELTQAYGNYIRLCQEANVVDYDDQIYILIQLFVKRPNILQKVRDSYDYIMVDEFQDTNVMQSVLVDMITGTKQNLFVVGDDDQSIYGWRGATLSNILSFKTRYPKVQEITLIENYRSGQEILDGAYQLISHNNPHRLEAQLRINKKLHSERSCKQPVAYIFETLDQELQWITENIKDRLERGEPASSIAVLARRNQTIQKLHAFLDYADVEHVVIGQRYELYQEPVVRILLEALRATVDPLDNTSLYHTLTGPLFSLPAMVIGEAASQARRQHQSLRSVIAEATDASFVAAQKAINQINEWSELSSTITVGQLAYTILDTSGYKDRLYKDPKLAVAGARLGELFNVFKDFERIALQPTALQYIESLPALQAAGDGGEDDTLDLSEQKVNLLTIHKAKGLEWPVVYIADCTEGSFPVRETSRGISLPDGLAKNKRTEADEHIYEERRLMYVAMTRAKDELILTHAEHHSSSSKRKPSRFLIEIFGDHIIDRKQPTHEGYPITVETFGATAKEQVPIPERLLKNGEVNVSVSQAIKYMTCPLDFYYTYILGVPEQPNAALEYGSIMHAILQDINRSLMEGQLFSFEVLQQRLATDWPKTGFFSSTQRERSFSQAQKTLRYIYDRAVHSPRVPITAEEPFAVKFDDFKLTLNGRFDAVFPLDKSVEIVDYKTSTTVTSPEQAKQRASASEQLTIYALAWQMLHDQLPALVTLDFIDTRQLGSLKKTQRGIDGLIGRLEKMADGIRAKNFEPGKDHIFCQHPTV
jgi:DNA helicase II / ATP-dependent DNA helicase PcrA